MTRSRVTKMHTPMFSSKRLIWVDSEGPREPQRVGSSGRR